LKKNCQILINFDTNISDKTGDRMTFQFSLHLLFVSALPGKQNQRNIAFCLISPFWVFPGSAEADTGEVKY